MGSTRFSTSTALALAAVVLSSSTTVFAVAALPRHSVGSKQLKTFSVTNSKIAPHAVSNSKIATGAVTGSKVAVNSLGGSQINESSLGTVPSSANAARLGQRIAFGSGFATSVPATTVLSLPTIGVTVTTDGTASTDPVVVVNLPSTAPDFRWVVNSTWESQTFSTTGGPLTLGAELPATTSTSREFTAHIWRSDNSTGIYLHCVFDTDNFSSARPLSCWAFST